MIKAKLAGNVTTPQQLNQFIDQVNATFTGTNVCVDPTEVAGVFGPDLGLDIRRRILPNQTMYYTILPLLGHFERQTPGWFRPIFDINLSLA
jgi:hypothetical protein